MGFWHLGHSLVFARIQTTSQPMWSVHWKKPSDSLGDKFPFSWPSSRFFSSQRRTVSQLTGWCASLPHLGRLRRIHFQVMKSYERLRNVYLTMHLLILFSKATVSPFFLSFTCWKKKRSVCKGAGNTTPSRMGSSPGTVRSKSALNLHDRVSNACLVRIYKYLFIWFVLFVLMWKAESAQI